MRAGRGSAKRGLTLIEVLIALTLLAVILLPVMAGFSQALITTSRSSITAVAISIAREKVEELKSQAMAGEWEQIATQEEQPRDFKPGDGFFRVKVDVDTIVANDPLTDCGLKRSVVSVYQTGSQGPAVTLTTYFTPSGV
jgi:prepilin-type N-terminal cleavage/methylation domain-containing protein